MSRSCFARCLAGLALLSGLLPTAAARQCLDGRLIPSDHEPDELFANFVAWQGDRIVVSANLKDGPGFDAGAAYVYHRRGGLWTEEQKLTPSDPSALSHFGFGVAIDGDTIVCGANWQEGPAGFAQGAAYVFRFDGVAWHEEAKLTSPAPAAFDFFGYGVLVAGDTVLLGCQGDDGAAADAGAVFVFHRVNGAWQQDAKIVAPDARSGDAFGLSLRLQGDRLLVSAPQADGPGGVDQGAVYVFRQSGADWIYEAKLVASDGASNDYFGVYLGGDDDVAVMSAHGDDIGGRLEQGSAYVFRRNGSAWTEEQKLTASDGRSDDWFGTAIAMRGDAIVVGAIFQDDDGWADQGAAYLYRRVGTRWQEEQKISNPDANFLGEFGSSMAFSDDGEIAIGARGTGPGACGTLYVFALDTPDCNGNGIPDRCEIFSHPDLDRDGNGVLDECDLKQVLVSGSLSNEVARFEGVAGRFAGTLDHVAGPQGMAFGPDHNLYVASEIANQVLRYDGRSGLPLGAFVADDPGTPADETGGLSSPSGLAFGPDGNLYVASFARDAVLRYDGATGAFLAVVVSPGAGQLDGPDLGLAFGPDGNLYVASFFNDRVNRYDPATGTFLGAFVAAGAGGLRGPRGIAFRSDGTLLVSSWGTSAILRYDASGRPLGEFATVDHPSGLVLGPLDRDLYVTSDVTDDVTRYDGRTGALVDTFIPAGSGGVEGATAVAFFPDLGLALSRPQPGGAGLTNRVEISGATARETVIFLLGTTAGSLTIGACPGAAIGIASPSVFLLQADDQGRVALSGLVPPAASGATVLLQAFEPSSCRVSNLVVHTFP